MPVMTAVNQRSPSKQHHGDAAIQIKQVQRATAIVIMAPHAGGIEPGTGRIAAAIASDLYSYYAYCGMLPLGNRRLHRPSHRFGEPNARRMVQNASTVVTVHGCKEKNDIVYVGGLDKQRGRAIAEALDAIGIMARTDPPEGMRGEHPDNLCNQGRLKMGIQLEVSMGLRFELLENPFKADRVAAPALHRFAQAVQKALHVT